MKYNTMKISAIMNSRTWPRIHLGVQKPFALILSQSCCTKSAFYIYANTSYFMVHVFFMIIQRFLGKIKKKLVSCD